MIYMIGSCVVDTNRYEIRRDGDSVAVEPQVFELLVLLIENRDRVVTKDEIVEKVWKGRIVSDAAISSRIKAARRAVGDDGKAQSLIRTVHRRGFRFIGAVTPEAEDAEARADAGRDLSGPTPAPLRTGAAAEGLGPLARSGPPAPGQLDHEPSLDDRAAGLDLSLPKQPSIVVLPFHTLSGEGDGQIISDGLSLDIMTRLARTRWLFVISRGTAFMFRGASHDTRGISRRLGVRYVLQGSVHLVGKRIRVHAALTDAVTGGEAWAEHFDCSVDDIFAIQDQIANDIVGAVETEIEQTERRRALLAHPASLDAWSAYHRGAWHMYQFTPEAYEEAERLFKLAAKLDPGASRVFAGLSFVHWQRAFLEISKDREGEIAQALEYAQHALLLDPREPQGYLALGRAFLLRQDFEQAIAEIGESVKLSPSLAIGHYSAGFARMLKADSSGSDVSVRQARRLSPYDLMSFAMLAVQGFNATLQGRFEEGANLADRAVRQPNAHYQILGSAAYCNAAAGREDMAREYLARLKKAHPGYRIRDYLRAFPIQERHLVREIRAIFRRLGLED